MEFIENAKAGDDKNGIDWLIKNYSELSPGYDEFWGSYKATYNSLTAEEKRTKISKELVNILKGIKMVN